MQPITPYINRSQANFTRWWQVSKNGQGLSRRCWSSGTRSGRHCQKCERERGPQRRIAGYPQRLERVSAVPCLFSPFNSVRSHSRYRRQHCRLHACFHHGSCQVWRPSYRLVRRGQPRHCQHRARHVWHRYPSLDPMGQDSPQGSPPTRLSASGASGQRHVSGRDCPHRHCRGRRVHRLSRRRPTRVAHH